MTRKRNQALWDQWERRIERQRTSGLSIAEFCRREGISQFSFHAWKRKLRQAGSTRQRSPANSKTRPRTVSRRPASRSSRPGPTTPTALPSFLQLPVRGTRVSPWIELTLADGTVIRVPQQNLAALDAVLRALRCGEVEAIVGEAPHA